MNLAEAYSLFMHGLNPQLCLLASILVHSGDLDEVVEEVEKVMVYSENKSGGVFQWKKKQTKTTAVVYERWQGEQKVTGTQWEWS